MGLAWAVAVLLIFAGAVLTGAVGAQEPDPTGGYALSWWSVDGGGVTSLEGRAYALGGTAGQPDAALWSGGDYALAGGFWGGVAVKYRVYLPLVVRN